MLPKPRAPPQRQPAVLLYRSRAGVTVVDFRLGGIAKRGPEGRADAQRVIAEFLHRESPGLVRIINPGAVLAAMCRPEESPGIEVWADGAPLCPPEQPCQCP